MSHLEVVNALLYVMENGCKWRRLPLHFGNWHTIYTRVNRWAKQGVLAQVFEKLQRHQLVRVEVNAVSLDSTSIKVHPDGTGARKKRSASHWQVPWRLEHQTSHDCRQFPHRRGVLVDPGPSAGDALAGRELLARVDWQLCPELQSIIMDRAYEGDETRQLVFELQFEPVVPPNPIGFHRRSMIVSCIRDETKSNDFPPAQGIPSDFCSV